MSAKLGTLTLDLIAKIGNFTGPIRDAERQTESSFANMRNHINSYGAVAITGAAAVGAGIFAMASEYANAARELETFAFISKTTTQEFQGYAVGAQTMGIEMETLAAQFKDFNEKLGEFVTLGSGGAVDFFEKIAIKTEGSAEGARKLALEMQNLSGPKALQLYVDKMEEVGVTQQQMSFYLESMASDTTNLIPLLKNGGEGFKFWADAAERAGVIMDEHAIKKANELSVQMDLLDLQVKGAKNQFIQGLMPALVSVGDSLTDATTETNLMSDAGATLGNVFMGVAAMGMGVYAVVKMLSNSIAGLSFDAINAKKNVDLAAESGSWADKLPGWKLGKALITGTTIAQAPNSGMSMAVQDNAKVVDEIGTAITGMFTRTTSQAVAAMAEIRNGQQGVTSGSDEWVKKQNEVAKAASGVNKALQEQNRLLEQQKRDREQISKAYLSDFEKINSNENEELQRILGAGFTSADQSKFTELAKMRFEGERAEYFKSLNLEFNQYAWSEGKKLEYAYRQNKEIAENDIRFSGVVKEAKLKFLDEQYAYQKRELEINQAKELLETKQLWMTAAEYAQQYYALVREEILNTPSLSPEMKSQKLDLLNLDTIRSGVGKNFSDPNDTESQFLHSVDYAPIQKSNTQWLDEEFQKQQEQMLANYENVKSLNADNHAVLLEAEREFLDAKQQLQDEYDFKAQDARKLDLEHQLSVYGQIASMTGATFGQMMDIVSQVKDENTKTYKTFFAINKAIAFAQAIINTEEGATKALAQGGIYGAALAMAVRVSGYASAGIIAGQAIAGPSGEGYADGGFTGYGGKYEHAGIVHKGEGVLTQEEIAALGGPAGFYALRESIKNGFSDGGLALDAPKVLNPNQNKDLTNYLSQAQSNSSQSQPIENNLRVIMVKDENEAKDWLYSPEGERAFLYHMKRNRSKV